MSVSNDKVKIEQNGKSILRSANDKLEMVIHALLLLILQFFPIIVFGIIGWITYAQFGIRDYSENILVICIVANSTFLYENFRKRRTKGSILDKLFIFIKCMIVALGSVIYTIILIDKNIAIGENQVIRNEEFIITFSIICLVITACIDCLILIKEGSPK